LGRYFVAFVADQVQKWQGFERKAIINEPCVSTQSTLQELSAKEAGDKESEIKKASEKRRNDIESDLAILGP
jgi:hypothetical protein